MATNLALEPILGKSVKISLLYKIVIYIIVITKDVTLIYIPDIGYHEGTLCSLVTHTGHEGEKEETR